MKDEHKRKVRICAGAFQAMGMLKELFNVFKYPVLFFQFVSHRILRWTLCPLCLIGMLASSVLLGCNGGSAFYAYIAALQAVFYGLAVVGWLLANFNISIPALYIPYYFLFMNIAVFQGFSRFIRKKQSVLWEMSGRNKYH